tara:strand:+ start:3108 stop:3374 length:267 start_codon:yes stop_codon:yes gene_type:complete
MTSDGEQWVKLLTNMYKENKIEKEAVNYLFDNKYISDNNKRIVLDVISHGDRKKIDVADLMEEYFVFRLGEMLLNREIKMCKTCGEDV